MPLTLESRRKRDLTLYFNADRYRAFQEVKGKTILVDDIDAYGQGIKRATQIPDSIREFTYLGFDMLVEQVKRYGEVAGPRRGAPFDASERRVIDDVLSRLRPAPAMEFMREGTLAVIGDVAYVEKRVESEPSELVFSWGEVRAPEHAYVRQATGLTLADALTAALRAHYEAVVLNAVSRELQ